MSPNTVRFDWYQGTVHGVDPEGITSRLQAEFPQSDIAPATPKNGYTHGAKIVVGQQVKAEVWFGGNPGVNVKGTGEQSPSVARVLREYSHRVTRADSCMDWRDETVFDHLAEKLLKMAKAKSITINQQGDWERGKARTLYLGSRSSAVQLVIYEKGYQVGGLAPLDWVRMEVRVKPKGESGYRVSTHSPFELFTTSKWVMYALRCVGYFEDLQHRTVGTVYRPRDDERAMAALVRQYGGMLSRLLESHGGDMAGAFAEIINFGKQLENKNSIERESDGIGAARASEKIN